MQNLSQYLEKRLESEESWRKLLKEAEIRKKKEEPSYTVPEILQQPWIWRRTAETITSRSAELEKVVRSTDHIFLTGAGSSCLVGECLKIAIEAETGKSASAVFTTDLIVNPLLFLRKSGRVLFVSFSRSGESKESVEAIEAVRETFPGYRQLLITCNPEGSLIPVLENQPGADTLVLHPASCDRGLAMTSSFTAMTLAGQSLALFRKLEDFRNHAERLAVTGEMLLRKIAVLFQELFSRVDPQRICLLGSNALRGTALEGALKIVEMTDGIIPTLSETYLGVRHGPLSFVNRQTLLIFFISSNPRLRRYEQDLVAEIRRKRIGQYSLAVGYGLQEDFGDLVDELIELGEAQVPAVDDLLRPPLDVLVPQVAALILSLKHGLDPDNPSPRGVISRVAQGVLIH